jgi:hypothetical protein
VVAVAAPSARWPGGVEQGATDTMNPIDPNDATSAVPDPVPVEPVRPSGPRVAGNAAGQVWTPPPLEPSPSASDPETADVMTPPAYESTVGMAPAQPVVKDAAPRRRRRSLRWAVALAVVVLVVGASAAVAALLVGRAPDATILGYVPQNTVMYGELRLDLPGDQRQAAGQFLSKFPGFADQAALEGKLDEVLDQLVKDASKGDQSYTTNIKPWFSGELGFALGPLPDASRMTSDPKAIDSIRALALLSIKDPAGAQAWFDAAFKKTGATTSTETYNGATVTVFRPAGLTNGPKAAFAIVGGKVGVAGDETSVKAAIDTKGNSGFADKPGPKTALDTADSNHIGFAYLELRQLMNWSSGLSRSVSGATGASETTALSNSMLDLLPEWGAYWLRVESDALVMEQIAPPTAKAATATSDHSSTIADHVPSSAVALAITNDYGKTALKSLDTYKSDPAFKQIYQTIDQALGLLGGEESALGWIGDSAIVVNVADGTPEGGLIIQPTDAAQAKRFFTSVKTLVGLGGQQIGAAVSDEPYNGTTITTVNLGKLNDLVAKIGQAAGATSMPPVSGLPEGNVEIAYATTDDVVVIGSGPAFVKHVLDTTRATSLGGNDRYQSLTNRAGKGFSSAFVDIAAIRGLVEGVMAKEDPAKFSEYQKNAQPYLAPFDAVVVANSVQGDLTHSKAVVTVK